MMPVNQLNAPANINTVCIPRIVMNCTLQSEKLNICHVNIQSICARELSKFDEFKLCFVNSKVDIICLTESWLTDCITDDLIAIDGYALVRNDRKYSRGGGICVYYKKFLQCKIVSSSELFVGMGNANLTEYLFLEIRHNQKVFLLGTFYNPPRSDCSERIFEKLSELSLLYTNIIMIGDFNTDMKKSNNKVNSFKSVIDYYGFKCINSEATHYYPGGSSLIDLLIVNNPTFILNLQQVSAPAFSRHDIIFTSIDIDRTETLNNKTYRDYNSIDTASLGQAINTINWNLMYNINDPDILIDFFNLHILELFDCFVPVRTYKAKTNPWFNVHILNAIIERDIAYRLWITNRNPPNHSQFKRLQIK